MKFKSVFDIIGPVMIGPSSSHTAGAARIGRVARDLFGRQPAWAKIHLYGSFAETYKGHSTDVAIVGGLLDYDTFDERIKTAFEEAEKLGMSQSAVSRQISALEDDLGLKLFIRHARGLVLTEVGEQLFRTAHRMHWELQQVETQMSESQDVPTGPLIVTTTVGIGST